MTAAGLASFYFTSLIVITVLALVLALVYLLTKNTKLKFWLTLSTIIITIFGLFVFSSIKYFEPSKSCDICHEMKSNYVTWKKSRHNNITCISCHKNSSTAIGFALEEPAALAEVFKHLTGDYPKIINKNSQVSQKDMTNSNCTRCHPLKQPTLIFGPRVKINHQAHIKRKIACPKCHNRVTHRGARGYNYLDGVRMMDGCLRCHKPTPSSCNDCHQDKNILAKTFGKEKIDLDNCDACHNLRDPSILPQFKKSVMFKEAGLTCQSCHKDHNNKDFAPNPDPLICNKHHKGINKKVVQEKHGKGIKNPFKTADSVRCTFCHKTHTFSNPK